MSIMAEQKIGPPLFKFNLNSEEQKIEPPLFKKSASCHFPQKIPPPLFKKSPFKSIKKPLNLLFKNLKTSSRKSNKSTLFKKSLKLFGGKKKSLKTFNTEKKPEFLYQLGRGSEPKVVADLGGNIWSIHECYIPHPSPPTTADEDEERVVSKPWDENEASTGRWSIGSIGGKNLTAYYCENVRDFFGDSPIIWDA